MADHSVAAIALAGEYEVGFQEAPAVYRATVESLEKEGVRVLRTDIVMYDLHTMQQAAEYFSGKSFDVILVCVATWSEDHHLLDLMNYLHKPVMLVAYPGMETGSLCGVQQIAAVFRDIGFTQFSFVYDDPGSSAAAAKIRQWVQVVSVAEQLRHSRVASIGSRCAGMTETAFDEFELLKKTGTRVVTIDESELLAEAEAAGRQADVITGLISEWKARFPNNRCSDEALAESAAYYLAQKTLVQRYDLVGLAIKCYTKYMGKICFGQALLAEEGIVASCEGDVNNVIMMKILAELSGGDVNCTDILNPDPAANTFLFAHCGNTGFTMAASQEEIELCPVRIVEQGVCARFTCRPGTVTAADLVGHGGTLRMSVMTGEAVPCSMEFPGTPVKIRFEKPVLQITQEIVEKGCGHHWMVAYGDYARQLAAFCRMTGIEYIGL